MISDSDDYDDHQDFGADATPRIDLKVEDEDAKLHLETEDKKDGVADSSTMER